MDIQVDAFIPTLCPLPRSEEGDSWYKHSIEEICQIKEIDHALPEELKPNVVVIEGFNIKTVEDTQKLPDFIVDVVSKLPFRLPYILQVSATCKLDVSNLRNSEYQCPSHLPDDVLASTTARLLLVKLCNDIIFAANIARPGCLQTTKGCLFYGEWQEDIREFIPSFFIEAVDLSYEIGWPTIQEISIEEVFKWLSNVPGFNYGFSRSRLGHALAAVSHLQKSSLFNEDSDAMDIMWAMLGLEALYCKGKNNLVQQLKENSEIYLGERVEHKKKLDQAYDFRSRLVHGDIDVPFSYSPYDATDEYFKYFDADLNAFLYTTAMLLATLQKMCLENRTELKFETVLCD